MSQATRNAGRIRIAATPRTEPFATTEEAWFWTMAALIARQDGARIVSGRGLVQRPCEPDDVVRSLDRLYRQRRIDLGHARILRRWGERQQAPDPRSPSESGDARLWQEALARLEWPLRVKGIVADGAATGREAAAILAFPTP
jgi:hypothetical protein